MNIKQIKQQLLQYDEMIKNSAELLLLTVISKDKSFLITNIDYQLSNEEEKLYQSQLSELIAGKPLAYIQGKQEFWSLEFQVNEYTLIPRPDTEILVEQCISLIKKIREDNSPDIRLLDMGTGSGAIAISIKHECPYIDVIATDMSCEALNVARINAQDNLTRVSFRVGSWYEALSEDGLIFDIIVSNPPYIDPDDEHLDKLTYEPISALVAANKGLSDLTDIIQGAHNHLIHNGWLILEHGYNQAKIVQAIFEKYCFTDITTIKDYGGNDRVTFARLQKKVA